MNSNEISPLQKPEALGCPMMEWTEEACFREEAGLGCSKFVAVGFRRDCRKPAVATKASPVSLRVLRFLDAALGDLLMRPSGRAGGSAKRIAAALGGVRVIRAKTLVLDSVPDLIVFLLQVLALSCHTLLENLIVCRSSGSKRPAA